MSLALGPAFGTPLGGLLRALWRPNAAGALVPALAVPLFMPRAPAWTVRLPSLLDALWDLFPPVLRAVPKKKVSHSRKAMRSANKGLKDKFNLVHCPACGAPKLAHHLCAGCFSQISRAWKRAGAKLLGRTGGEAP